MKKAIIAVGSHYAGKSKTINEFLKSKLGIGELAHKFIRNGQNGFILSQSFEEAGRDIDYVLSEYGHYDLLVLAARPANEKPSYLNEAINGLQNAGFRVNTIEIIKDEDDYYNERANDILRYLDN